jgi:hypothetical protein
MANDYNGNIWAPRGVRDLSQLHKLLLKMETSKRRIAEARDAKS